MYEAVSEIVSPVYQVGGSVRDEIIGRTPKDYDFTTPLSVDEVEAKVRAANRRPYLIGKKFGTIGFKVQRGDGIYQSVEVTTFRRESYTPGSRKPSVEFVTNLKDDLARRDFTFNAIAKQNDKLIDPFGGRLDILERKIKCVGHPKDRFTEDPLRMLRMARFAAQLGFEVDQLAWSTASRMSHNILYVSKERWVMEMDKMLMTDNIQKGINIMIISGLLKFVLPEFEAMSSWQAAEAIQRVEQAPKDVDTRWAALLSNIGKPLTMRELKDKVTYPHSELLSTEMAHKIGLYLKWSNARMEEVERRIKSQNFD